MTPRSHSLVSRRGRALFLVSTFFFAAVAAAQDAPTVAVGQEDAWIGRQIGLAEPRMTFLGTSPVVPEDARVADSQVSAAAAARWRRGDTPPVPAETIALVAVNATTGETYRLEAPRADFERLHLAMVMRGEASAKVETVAPGNAAAGSQDWQKIAGRSWSDGVANFVRRGIADGYPANQDIYRRIGQIGSGCSGTLVGARHVLTAAHCVVDNTDGTVYSSVFRPRRDWTEGTTSPTEAYGSRSFVWYYFPVAYWDGTCNTANTADCNKYDIALGILSSNMAVPFMGYWYAPIATLDSWSKYMRGYPRCFTYNAAGAIVYDAERPPGCTRSTLYGDSGACHIGDWASPDGDGYNRELFVDCDGARGMSGSAMYTSGSPGGLVALGVYSQYLCTAAACATDPNGEFPNIITRVTPEYAQMISMAKSLWSCASGTCP